MKRDEIKEFLENHRPKRERTIVIVDFGNVEKWKHGLGWRVGIRPMPSSKLPNAAIFQQVIGSFGASITVLTTGKKNLLLNYLPGHQVCSPEQT